MKKFILAVVTVLLFIANSQGQTGKKPLRTKTSKTAQTKNSTTDSTMRAQADAEALRMKQEMMLDITDKKIKARIIKMVGTRYTYLTKIAGSGGPCTITEPKDDLVYNSCCWQHNCCSRNYMIVANTKTGILYLGIKENPDVKTYSEDGSVVPSVLAEWAKQKCPD